MGPNATAGFNSMAEGSGRRGLMSGGLAALMGAPVGATIKSAAAGVMSPIGMLTGMAGLAMGGLDDVAVDNRMANLTAGIEGLTPEQIANLKDIENVMYAEQGFRDKTGERFGALGTPSI